MRKFLPSISQKYKTRCQPKRQLLETLMYFEVDLQCTHIVYVQVQTLSTGSSRGFFETHSFITVPQKSNESFTCRITWSLKKKKKKRSVLFGTIRLRLFSTTRWDLILLLVLLTERSWQRLTGIQTDRRLEIFQILWNTSAYICPLWITVH